MKIAYSPGRDRTTWSLPVRPFSNLQAGLDDRLVIVTVPPPSRPHFSVAARKATSAMRCRGLACANTAAGHSIGDFHICPRGLYVDFGPVQEMHLHDERFLLLNGSPPRSGGARLSQTTSPMSEASALAAVATTARFSGACLGRRCASCTTRRTLVRVSAVQ